MRPGPIDVILPVRGAAEALARLLDSLVRSDAGCPMRLHVVLDGPQDEGVLALAESAPQRLADATVLRLETRQGFVRAVNLGSSRSRGDLVWLNSDVEVPDGWLERLRASAYSGPRVATATPLTNNGTIASIPRWLEENALPAGYDLERFATLVERVAAPFYPEIPTGVGFCLFVRREAWEAVGSLDESAFGEGYGEEVDWCLRAARCGWTHVLDDRSFVYHRGGSSFGARKLGLEARAERRLSARHRGWRRSLAGFLARDPIAPVRQRVLAELDADPRAASRAARPAVAHVVHGWPPWSRAGTETYAARLVRWQARTRSVAVLARYAPTDRAQGAALELVDQGARVRLLANRFLQRDPRSRNALVDRRWERELERLLQESGARLLHVHHLAGHALALPRAAKRLGLPVVWQLQDWWLLCARANLLDRTGSLCNGPRDAKCAHCLPATRLPPARLWSAALYSWRRRLAREALAGARAVIAGSRTVVDDHRKAGLIPSELPVYVLDYAVGAGSAVRPETFRGGRPLRLGFLGSDLPHKGLAVLARAMARLPKGKTRLVLWGEAGNATSDPTFPAGLDVELRPAFDEGAGAVELASLDLLVAPSLGLESFGLAAAEAHAAGVPVLVSDRGALPERVANGGGAVFPAGDESRLAAELEAVLADPSRLERWRQAIPQPRPFDEHASEIDAVYSEILNDGGRR